MSQSQEVAVERLITVIQRLQRGRMTGTLTVRRGDGITAEEGSVDFSRGQITQARVSRRNGSEALSWLSTWSNCYCSFESATRADVDMFLRLLFPPSDAGSLSTTQQSSTSQLEPTARQTDALRHQTGPMSPTTPRTLLPSEHSFSQTSLAHFIPQAHYPMSEALRLLENQKLTRTHRHLLLLIDGRRSIAELIRVMNRSDSEVIHLLRDLENASIIHIQRAEGK
jgi:hypothetical protein